MKELFKVNVSKYSSQESFNVCRPSSLDSPKDNSVMFVMDKYIEKVCALSKVKNCLVFWPESYEIPVYLQKHHVFVLCKSPRKEYNRFFKENGITYYPKEEPFDMIGGAYICKTAKIGRECVIMPGAYIGGEVIIGDNVYIGCGAKLVGSVTIGNGTVIRENSVIGADGLTTERDDDGSALTMPQFGSVIIGNRVQIGANTVVGRGAIDDTIIGDGSKIDNGSFISHNVVIGDNVFIVGETLLMGSVKVGKNAYISGNVVIRNKTTIGEESFIGMGSVVTKDVTPRTMVLGNPAKAKEER